MKKWRITIIVFAIIVLGFVMHFIGILKPVKNTFWKIIQPFGLVSEVSIGHTSNFFKVFFNLRDIVRENKKIIKKNIEGVKHGRSKKDISCRR